MSERYKCMSENIFVARRGLMYTCLHHLVLVMLIRLCKPVLGCQYIVKACTFPYAQQIVCLVCGHLRCCKPTSTSAVRYIETQLQGRLYNTMAYRLLADLLMLSLAAVSQTFCFCDNKNVVLPSDDRVVPCDRA